MPVFGHSNFSTRDIIHGIKKLLEEKSMKRLALVLLALLLFFSTGCRAEESAAQGGNAEYSSNLSAEDCYLCGDGIENLNLSCWGQKNVAFVSLNTFEVIPIEINRYDEIDGHLIEEYSDAASFEGKSNPDGGFSVKFLMDFNHGLGIGEIELHNDETLDVGKASSFLCVDCINKIAGSELGPSFGVAAIDLETKKIFPFYKNISGFPVGDFYIYSGAKSRKDDNSLSVGTLVFYCPSRFEAPLEQNEQEEKLTSN